MVVRGAVDAAIAGVMVADSGPPRGCQVGHPIITEAVAGSVSKPGIVVRSSVGRPLPLCGPFRPLFRIPIGGVGCIGGVLVVGVPGICLVPRDVRGAIVRGWIDARDLRTVMRATVGWIHVDQGPAVGSARA